MNRIFISYSHEDKEYVVMDEIFSIGLDTAFDW